MEKQRAIIKSRSILEVFVKKNASDSTRKRRRILAVALVGVFVVIGGVIAYNQDAGFFRNLFHLGSVGPEEFIETFDSPDNWGCQVETPKAVRYKNDTGAVRVVRAKYEEYWKEAGSTSTDHTTELPLTRNGERTTILTFENEDDWIKNDTDGWYYYYYKVADGETTSNFLGSVIYNCDLSEPEGFSCEQTATGATCESTKNSYAGATYHVYVTVQTEEFEDNTWPVTAYDRRETLYDVIAAQTNGLDTNVNFNLYATKSFGNGNGVNTLSSHAGDKYPVYYFRGEVDNNNVVYENHCWKIVRTAESGAIKMIYAGNYDTENKTCANNTQDDYYINNGTDVAWNVGPGTSVAGADMRATPATVGYMYGNDIYAQQNYSIGTGGYAGTGVTWDGTKYTLINPKLPSELTLQDIEGDYRYYCYWTDVVSDGNNRSCTKARYFSHAITNGSGPFGYGLVLTGGVTDKDTAVANMNKNQVSSTMKQAIDSWFASTITHDADKLADVQYCNDRHVTYGSLGENNTYNWTVLYDSWVRVGSLREYKYADAHAEPTIDCRNRNDAFTKTVSKGNGALTYPTALLSADEYVLAGIGFNGGYWAIDTDVSYDTVSCYWYTGEDYDNKMNFLHDKGQGNSKLGWTMSPLAWTTHNPYHINVQTSNLNAMSNATAAAVRPVVALRNRTYVKSGTGTEADPYIVEWDN